jgi:hypothetical protein
MCQSARRIAASGGSEALAVAVLAGAGSECVQFVWHFVKWFGHVWASSFFAFV